MHHQHTAADITAGDIVTYEPALTPGAPARTTIHVLAVDMVEGLAVIRALSFAYSSWPHLHMDRLDPAHPVTVVRVQWATIGDRLMAHVITPADAEGTTTWCEARGADHIDAALMPRYPLCRTCGYRAAKEAAAAAAPFTYRLPPLPAAEQPADADGAT